MAARYWSLLLLLVISSLLCGEARSSAQCADLDAQPRWLGTASFHYGWNTDYKVVRRGNVVYAFDGQRGYVVDFSDRAEPAVVDSISVFGLQFLAYGDHIYAASGEALTVLDVSTPEHPVVVTELATEGRVQPLQRYGDLLFGADLDPLDISDPAQPVVVESSGYAGTNFFLGFLANAGYAYQSATGSALVLDLSDPLVPVETGVTIRCYGPDPCLAAGDRFAVVGGRDSLRVLDTTDPIAPRVVKTFPTIGVARKLFIQDRVLCQVDWGDLHFWDLTSLDTPVLLGSVGGGSSIADVAFAVDEAFVVDVQARVAALDFSRLGFRAQPLALGIPGVKDFAFAGNTVLSIASVAGIGSLTAYDVSDPRSPDFVDSVVFSDLPKLMAVDGGVAVITCADGLRVVDVSSPANLRLVGYLPWTDAWYAYVQLADNVAYLLGENFAAVDVSAADAPVFLGTAAVGPFGKGLEVSGGSAFIRHSGFIEVVDVADPAQPVVSGEFAVPWGSGLGLADTHLFVGRDEGGFASFEISDPTAPAPSSAMATLGQTSWFAFAGARVFAGDASGGCQVVDISDPDAPRWEGTYHGIRPTRLRVHNGWVYIATSSEGLYNAPLPCSGFSPVGDPIPVLSRTGIAAAVQPNPFNPGTFVSFDISTRQEVQVAVYDLKGRRLATIAGGSFERGRHEVFWDGKTDGDTAAASGVYVFEIKTARAREVVKAALLK